MAMHILDFIWFTEDQCKYNGKSYNQGDTWTDGCQYNCTCVDGSTGHYSCNPRYV